MKAENFILELYRHADPLRAEMSLRFFKTGPGQYGEGDKFIGANMPDIRKACKLFKDLPLNEIQKLLNSPIHEYRLSGAIILANKYPKSNNADKQKIFNMYLKNVAENKINNWDIVDVTCEHIVGAHLADKNKKILYELAKSDNLWERRVAMISTFFYIKRGDPAVALYIAEILLNDKHDLIQKATGWMLREVGKRVDEQILTNFLEEYASIMPRTMLRYSIEKLQPDQRQYYMRMKNK